LALAALLLPLALAFDHDAGVWTSVALQDDLHDGESAGPRVWLDLHGRRWGSKFIGIVRPAVGWDVSKHVGFMAGYGYVIGFDGEAVSHEHRLWEQALVSGRVPLGVQLGLRLRVEHRWLMGHVALGQRLRALARVMVPITDTVAAVVTDEVFVGLNETDWAPFGFDQNRLFVGPAVQVSKPVRLELGYLNNVLSSRVMVHNVGTNVNVNW
jgi:hypothetical protein